MSSADPFGLADLPDPLPIEPLGEPLDGEIRPPGSKSITNRALVCAALASGRSRIVGALSSDDTIAMLGVLGSLGVPCEIAEDQDDFDDLVIEIEGADGHLPPSDRVVDCRQSGTTARFALPMLALGEGTYEVTAHAQMQARPMDVTFAALEQLGAAIEPTGVAGHLPIRLRAIGDRSDAGPKAIEVAGDASSQFLSGLLLMAPCLPGGLTISLTTDLVSRPYVELTIAAMEAFGAEVRRPDERTFEVPATGYRHTVYEVEPDASGASYPLAAAALVGGRVTVDGLGVGALQGDAGFADVLAQMGATVERTSSSTTVTGPADGVLRGGTFDFTHISDTAQTLAVLAPFADSPVTITGIGFIRRKEIDRVQAVATELRRAGVRVDVDDDGWTIHPGPVAPTTFETYDDHRMAMSFALIGLRVPGIAIAGPACVAKTFPGYWDLLAHLRDPESAR